MKNNIGILSAFVLAFSLATAITHAAAPPAAQARAPYKTTFWQYSGDSEKKVLSLADAVLRANTVGARRLASARSARPTCTSLSVTTP